MSLQLAGYVQRFDLAPTSALLLNPVSGAIDLVPIALLANLAGQPETAVLQRRGYFLTEAERRDRLARLAEISQRHSRYVPYWFYVLTTLNCNLACPICYERRVIANADIDRATLASAYLAIGRFQRDHGLEASRINVILFGGEPLLVRDRSLIEAALTGVADRGWQAVIVTNGTLVNRHLERLKAFRQSISDLRVTLDGPPEIHDARRPYRGRARRGTFAVVTTAIDRLLANGLPVKMQTILGRGNASCLTDLIGLVESRGWLADPLFQWRIEASHDYANLDADKDEISEGRIVRLLIRAWDDHPALRGQLKFESFKYLGHLVRSFGWLGDYKTYWGPKLGFCDPQRGFHYVFSTDGRVYHCPRTINQPRFLVGQADTEFWPAASPAAAELKGRTILDRPDCAACDLNTLCGGGCVVQRSCYPGFDCRARAYGVISEFVELMKDRLVALARPDSIVSVNELW